MFQGASVLALDAKGRISIPSRYREALQLEAEKHLTITKHPDGCLMLFPRPAWEAFRKDIVALPMDAHWWRRIFLGNAFDVDLDSAGRALISPALRAASCLEKEVILLGMGRHFELWDAQIYYAKEQAAVAQGMPDALKNFTF